VSTYYYYDQVPGGPITNRQLYLDGGVVFANRWFVGANASGSGEQEHDLNDLPQHSSTELGPRGTRGKQSAFSRLWSPSSLPTAPSRLAGEKTRGTS